MKSESSLGIEPRSLSQDQPKGGLRNCRNRLVPGRSRIATRPQQSEYWLRPNRRPNRLVGLYPTSSSAVCREQNQLSEEPIREQPLVGGSFRLGVALISPRLQYLEVCRL